MAYGLRVNLWNLKRLGISAGLGLCAVTFRGGGGKMQLFQAFKCLCKVEPLPLPSLPLLSQLQMALKVRGRGHFTQTFRSLKNLEFQPPPHNF